MCLGKDLMKVGSRVEVVGNIPGLDILRGDVYRVTAIDLDGKIKINHNLGTRFDIFLETNKFKVIEI